MVTTGSSTLGTPTSGLCDHPSLRNHYKTQTKKKHEQMWSFLSHEMVQTGCIGAAPSVQRLNEAELDPQPV